MQLSTGLLRILVCGFLTMGVLAPASAETLPTMVGMGLGVPYEFGVWASVSATGGYGGDPTPGHTCGIRVDGTLWCWGRNLEGQLGLGDTTSRYRPAHVGVAAWEQVDTYFTRTCGIRSEGTLWCWGNGIGNTPQQIGQANTWTQIAMGANGGEPYYCGVQSDTTLWCWGDNGAGQLGLGDHQSRAVPTELGPGWRLVTAYWGTTCGIQIDGTLWCWGANYDGELGVGGSAPGGTDVPLHVLPGSTWVSVVEGAIFTCGVQSDATLWCWGNNDLGELGLGDSGEGAYRDVPTQVGIEADWSAVTAGVYHACGVRNGGELWCWGSDQYGDLGLGGGGMRDSPAQVGSDPVWGQPAAGADDSCATRLDHTLWCWGLPDEGELGVGSRTKNTFVPVQVGPPNHPIPVSYRLVSVSADSGTDIWAVGTRQRKQVVTTYVVHGDGSTWSQVPAVNPSRRDTAFTAVHAIAPDDVWAVGSYRVGTTTYPLTEHWDGTSWTKVAAPGATAELSAIYAIAPDDLWAVGQTTPQFGYPDNVVEHWDGKSWTSYQVSNPRWAEQLMTGVAAVSHSNLWTVGYGLTDEEGNTHPVTWHWNGKIWRQVHPAHSEYMRGIDATPAGDLWAAGDEGRYGSESTRIEHYADGSWKLAKAPSPGAHAFVRSV
jgi:alpha-tubulin suppressor-like RCC1 family protein